MNMNFFRFLGINTRVVPFLSMITILCHISEESSPVLTVKDNVYTCITDSVSALVNNQTDDKKSTFQHDDSFNCDISRDKSSCNQKWTPTDRLLESDESDTGHRWEIASSIESKIDQLILDYRWERFPTYTLTSQRLSEKLVTVKGGEMVVPMSTKGNYGIDLHWYDGPRNSSNCFRFRLMRNVTILDKCYGSVQNCEEVVKEDHTEKRSNLEGLNWNHYLLTMKNNKVTLSSEKENIILEYEYPNSFLKTSGNYYLYGRAQQEKAYVKIHSYEFVKTEEAVYSMPFGSALKSSDGFYCISMFILTCAECSLNFKFDGHTYQSNSHETNRSSTKPYRWEYEKIYFKSNATELQLNIGTLGEEEGIWAIDSVQKCQLDEVRSVSYNEAVSCGTLADKNHVELIKRTKLIDDLNTSNWSLRDEITSNSTVCVSGDCYCRYGYYGDFCLEKKCHEANVE